MRVSTRLRYGLRLMVFLARHHGAGPVALKDAAGNEDISGKYLSLIAMSLRSAGLIQSTRGAGGGYALAREPEAITVADIAVVLEGECGVVNCVQNPATCPRFATCPTRRVWCILDRKIGEALASISLASLASASEEENAEEKVGCKVRQ